MVIMSTTLSRLADTIRVMRAERGWTQAQLAQKCGVSQQQIARLERPTSNPTVEILVRLSKGFGRQLFIRFEGAAIHMMRAPGGPTLCGIRRVPAELAAGAQQEATCKTCQWQARRGAESDGVYEVVRLRGGALGARKVYK